MNIIDIANHADYAQHTHNYQLALKTASAVLKKGGIIVFPTDTSYGLGVDALNAEAIAKLYALKGRNFNKPIHIIVADLVHAQKYVHVTPLATELATKHLPGALTLVLNKTELVPAILVAGGSTLGIRMPANKFCLDLAKLSGIAFTATSATISGQPDNYSIEDVITQFGAKAELVDLFIDQGVLDRTILPSTVANLTGARINIIRQGPVII